MLRLTGAGYQLDAEDVDLLEFRRALAAARRAGEAGCKEEALARPRDGVGLWQDRTLADLGGVQRGHPLVAVLEREYLDAVVALADAEMEAGDAGAEMSMAKLLSHGHGQETAAMMPVFCLAGRTRPCQPVVDDPVRLNAVSCPTRPAAIPRDTCRRVERFTGRTSGGGENCWY